MSRASEPAMLRLLARRRLHRDVIDALTELASSAHITPAQVAQVCVGWARMFQRLRVPLVRQPEEFSLIMRARVQAGSISIIADGEPPLVP